MKKKPVFSFLLAFLMVTVVFYFYFMILGATWFEAFCRITDGWILSVAVFTIYDLVYRLFNKKETINGIYIAMTILIMLSVLSFAWSSVQVNPKFLLAGISIAIILGTTAGVLPRVVIAIKGGRTDNAGDSKKLSSEDFQKRWIVLRVKLLKTDSVEKKKELLYDNLLFKLVGDDIKNSLDTSSPLIVGNSIAYTVNSSENNEELKTQRENAIAYIETVINKLTKEME